MPKRNARLSGQQRWFLTGYRLVLPLVFLAIVEQLIRYRGILLLWPMAAAALVLAGLWGLTFVRPAAALKAGVWVISGTVWLGVLQGGALLPVDPVVGAALVRETTFWVPVVCAFWAMMFYARRPLVIAAVLSINLAVLAADAYARSAGVGAIVHGTFAQAVLQAGVLVVMVWIFGGVHQRVVTQRNIARTTAIRDTLTGLHNRLSFEHEIRRIIDEADRYGHAFGLIVADIDHFKRFNDRHGHLAGDSAIRAVARACRRTLRRTDLISRWGGEEFAVIVHHAGIEQALRAADKIRQAVAAEETEAGEGVTISCGVAIHESGEDMRELFARADSGLMLAKAAGRNLVMCGPPREAPEVTEIAEPA